MDYPPDFPDDLKPPIERALARAELERVMSTSARGLQRTTTSMEGVGYAYVKRVFFAFAEQARSLAMDGLWSLEKTRMELERLLQRLSIDSYPSYLPGWVNPHAREMFVLHVKFSIKTSDDWIKHELAMALIADAAAKRSTPISSSNPAIEPHETTQSTSLERKAMFAAFRLKFPDATILDVCWAANQRYREWTRWTTGKLKNGSKPDRCFRAVLSSEKGPKQYRLAQRPKGWK